MVQWQLEILERRVFHILVDGEEHGRGSWDMPSHNTFEM